MFRRLDISTSPGLKHCLYCTFTEIPCFKEGVSDWIILNFIKALRPPLTTHILEEEEKRDEAVQKKSLNIKFRKGMKLYEYVYCYKILRVSS